MSTKVINGTEFFFSRYYRLQDQHVCWEWDVLVDATPHDEWRNRFI